MISGSILFHVSIHLKTNYFEVIENNSAVATGVVRLLKDTDKEIIPNTSYTEHSPIPNALCLKTKDFYKELRLRGYNYNENFKRVAHVDVDGMFYNYYPK